MAKNMKKKNKIDGKKSIVFACPEKSTLKTFEK